MISLNELAGVKTLPGVGSSATAFDWNNLGQAALGMTGRGLVNAGISTAINGGSFGAAFRQSLVGDLAAVGANGIGTAWGGGTNPAMQTATHGLLGCAAAEARGKDCASGAIGGMSESLLGNAIDRFGRLPTDANGEYSKGTRALYTGGAMLLADIVTHAAGRDTLTAMDAARNAATNNYLSNWQKAAYDKEIRACKDDLACKVGASVRWGATSVKQDAALVSGMALGATFEVKDAVAALAELPRTIEMLANDPALLKTLPDGYLKGLQTSYRNYQTALETAGVDGATAAGVEFTHLLTQLALIPATVATGGAAAGYTIGKTAGLLGKLGAEGTTLAKVPGVVSGARGAATADEVVGGANGTAGTACRFPAFPGTSFSEVTTARSASRPRMTTSSICTTCASLPSASAARSTPTC